MPLRTERTAGSVHQIQINNHQTNHYIKKWQLLNYTHKLESQKSQDAKDTYAVK